MFRGLLDPQLGVLSDSDSSEDEDNTAGIYGKSLIGAVVQV